MCHCSRWPCCWLGRPHALVEEKHDVMLVRPHIRQKLLASHVEKVTCTQVVRLPHLRNREEIIWCSLPPVRDCRHMSLSPPVFVNLPSSFSVSSSSSHPWPYLAKNSPVPQGYNKSCLPSGSPYTQSQEEQSDNYVRQEGRIISSSPWILTCTYLEKLKSHTTF